MKCEDCIHYDVCKAVEYGYGVPMCDADFCGQFKDNSKVHSQWVYDGEPIHCKACGFNPPYSLSRKNALYCPCCGAKMER